VVAVGDIPVGAGTSAFVVSRRAGIQIVCRGGNNMKSGTQNEVTGKIHEVKGKIKEKVGQLTNNPSLEGEGIGERIAGKVQKKIGHVQKTVEKTVKP
jgi:uncharacterized protein YjbJ (UPF0337 family)